jgi:hypothetical protein
MTIYDPYEEEYASYRSEQARVSAYYRRLRAAAYSGDPTVDVPDDWEEILDEIEECF